MKKIFVYFITILSLLINSCVTRDCVAQVSLPALPIQLQQIDQMQKIDLEHVNFSRIEKAVKKYESLQSKAKWAKRLKYAAIGAGCAGIGWLILNQWLKSQDKAQCKSSDKVGGEAKAKNPVENQPDLQTQNADKTHFELKKIELEVKLLEKKLNGRTFGERIKKVAKDSVDFVIYSVIASILAVSFWKIVNNSSDVLKDHFAGVDLQDPNFYKQKNEKINGLIQRLGLFLIDDKQNFQNKDAGVKFFDLVFADVLIDHTTLVRWFEDIVGFIKYTVILSNGNDSLELACLENDIEVLAGKLDQFTDEISTVINSPNNQERSKLIAPAVELYLNFCKQFSKFIYDCGLYLYEDDFLRN